MIYVEPENLDSILKALTFMPQKFKSATSKAIRKTLTQAKSDGVNLVKRRYTLPASIVRSSMSVSVRGFSGELRSRGSRNPLEKAKVTPKGRITSRGRYIRAEVIRGQGGNLRTAFRKSSGESVYMRLTAKRFPIKKLKTVSAPGMLAHEAVSEPLVNKIADRFAMNFLFSL